MTVGTQSSEVPQPSPAEALHYGGEATGTFSDQEMQAAKIKAAEDRREKASNPDIKSYFEKYAKKIEGIFFTKQNKDDLDIGFGAGEYKPTTDPAEAANPKSTEAENLHNEYQAEFDKIDNFIKYSEIAEAVKSGKTLNIVLSEKGVSANDYPQLKNNALDYILSTDVIKGIPGMESVTSLDDRRKLIEETLATDPALRAKVNEKMVNLSIVLKNLPESPVNKELNEANADRTKAVDKKNENLDLVRNKITNLGIDSDIADQFKGDIERYVGEGKSVEQIVTILKTESLSKLKNASSIEEYDDALGERARLQERLTILDVRKSPDAVAETNKELEEVNKTINNFKARLKDAANGSALKKELNTWIEIKTSLTSQEKDGVFQNSIANGIDQIIKAQKDILDTDKVIKEKGDQDSETKRAWKIGRLVKESNLISDMKDIMQSSIAEVMIARSNEIKAIEEKRLAKIAEEDVKKGEEAMTGYIKNINGKKEKNWSRLNQETRKQEFNRVGISEDVKYLLYGDKETADKRLILRYSELKLVDDNGSPLKDADGNLVTYETIDFSKLPDKLKKTFDKLYSQVGTSFKQELFRNFFLARNFMLDNTIYGRPLGRLALSPSEYRTMQEKYGEVFSKGIETKAEMKVLAEKLKADGIKDTGGILQLLALFLSAPVIGVKKAMTG